MEILPEEKIISYQINEQDVEVPAVSANVFLKNVLVYFSNTYMSLQGLYYTFHIKDTFCLRTLRATIMKHNQPQRSLCCSWEND